MNTTDFNAKRFDNRIVSSLSQPDRVICSTLEMSIISREPTLVILVKLISLSCELIGMMMTRTLIEGSYAERSRSSILVSLIGTLPTIHK